MREQQSLQFKNVRGEEGNHEGKKKEKKVQEIEDRDKGNKLKEVRTIEE